jgi:hypothetical protein
MGPLAWLASTARRALMRVRKYGTWDYVFRIASVRKQASGSSVDGHREADLPSGARLACGYSHLACLNLK